MTPGNGPEFSNTHTLVSLEHTSSPANPL